LRFLAQWRLAILHRPAVQARAGPQVKGGYLKPTRYETIPSVPASAVAALQKKTRLDEIFER